MSQRLRHAIFFLAFLPFCAQASPGSKTLSELTAAQLSDGQSAVLDELNPKSPQGKPTPLDWGDPRVKILFNRGWALAGEWAARFFDAHPQPSDLELEHVFDSFGLAPHGVKSQYGDFTEYNHYCFSGRATKVGDGVYVVESSYFRDSESGTFIVVARNRDGHFHAVWNIKDLAQKHYATRDEIGRWYYLVRRSYYDGPLNVDSIKPLPLTANGKVRFLVDAYQSADGGTTMAELSIWEWNGVQVKALLIEPYQHVADSFDIRIHDSIIQVATKEHTDAIFTCGQCEEPKGIWRIRVSQDGVRDLGHSFLTPEIHWADQLLSTIAAGRDASSQATPAVISTLKKNQAGWGMLDSVRVIRRGERVMFEVKTDEGTLRLSYIRYNTGPYFTSARFDSLF